MTHLTAAERDHLRAALAPVLARVAQSEYAVWQRQYPPAVTSWEQLPQSETQYWLRVAWAFVEEELMTDERSQP